MDPRFLVFLLSSLIMIPTASQLSFDFSIFNQSTQGITFQGNASQNQFGIDLTQNDLGASIGGSVGRAVYQDPVLLWDSKTEEVTDFTTHFSFIIKALDNSSFGDGLAFFMSPNPSVIPPDSAGGYLALFSSNTSYTAPLVAVEFDTHKNDWDPSPNHVGINANSIQSNVTVEWNSSINDGRKANVWITYNASTKNLSVFLTYADNPEYRGNSTLSYVIDLKKLLPETISIGFSAATGLRTELHRILSWDFSSTLELTKTKSAVGLVVGMVVTIGAVLAVATSGAVWFIYRAKRKTRNEDEEIIDESIDEEFEKSGRGPKRFPYRELVIATKNFSEDAKLGEGGFGVVYKGFLIDSNLDIAVKRVAQGSKQGKKEYISEVKIISRLRHRNLVQLVGWCHARGELLLVYEFMPNGSLDFHLYGKKRSLDWSERYKIALGLSSALLYLHDEWEQCVVHRDVKPSNVMLDSGFNAKLGDFGLARLVDHDQGAQTTILAGTMGYLAPECVTIGKASKESDVYSFGVVALEIACGRKPVEPKEQLERVRLVEWVWGLYGRRTILEAVDSRLNLDFNEQQMERLMVVGLWCAHPDINLRPSIRQAIGVLNVESPLPELPPQMPVPMYLAPLLASSYALLELEGLSGLSSGSSSGFPTTLTNLTVSDSSSSSAYLLKSYKTDV